jgi:hypothetical protein
MAAGLNTMDVIIQSLGFRGEGLEIFIREKLDSLVKQRKIIRAYVTLFIDTDSSPVKYNCEIRLQAPGKDHFIKRNSSSFERAIVNAVATLHNVIRKAKGETR